MSWLWPAATGQPMEPPDIGFRVEIGPHWKPATKRVSPAAPARPLDPEAFPLELPVCAVPQAAALRPTAAPPTASPVRVRKRRRLGTQLVRQSPPPPAISADGSICSGESFMLSFL